MMKTLLIAAALFAIAGGAQTAPLDPIGQWRFSTTNEEGQPSSGILEITGASGAYAGTITTAEGRQLQIVEVMTSPTGVLLLANIPDGGAVVIKITKTTSGFEGHWGTIRNVIPAKVERAK